MRVAMKTGTNAITYLHPDHLSSTAMSTNSTGAFQTGQGYFGYGTGTLWARTGGSLPTQYRPEFIEGGQELDIATGLMYYGARYYDRSAERSTAVRQAHRPGPELVEGHAEVSRRSRTVGFFISPDTIVPDPTHVYDYNHMMYVRRGNPIKYNDPIGYIIA
jgi:hypothetical protein